MLIHDVSEWLKARDEYIVLVHRRPDGDALGCAAALVEGLRAIGKTAYMLDAGDVGMYMPYVKPYWAPEGYVPKTVISVDMATDTLMQRGGDVYIGRIELSIDHHPSNTGYAGQTYVDPTKAACGEIIYELLLDMKGSISQPEALQLFYAITTDTGCFSYSNTTAECMHVAANLIELGAPATKLNKEFHRTKSRERAALEAVLTANKEFYRDGKIGVIMRTKEAMNKVGVTERDADDIAKIPGTIEGVEVGITLSEIEEKNTKISVRTTELVDSNAVCAQLGGGGHKAAAGCYVEEDIYTAKKMILAAVENVWPAE